MDDILDEQPDTLPPAPPWWPSVVMGGLAGAALVIVFDKITSNGGPIVIIHLIVTFIVLNSTLNHYRAKLYSNQSYLTAFGICFGTYLLMMVASSAIMLLWFNRRNFDFSFSLRDPLHSVVMLIGGGLVMSVVAAFLSKRYTQP